MGTARLKLEDISVSVPSVAGDLQARQLVWGLQREKLTFKLTSTALSTALLQSNKMWCPNSDEFLEIGQPGCSMMFPVKLLRANTAHRRLVSMMGGKSKLIVCSVTAWGS